MDNVELEFEQGRWMRSLRKRSCVRPARGLRSIVEGALLDVMYEIPSRSDAVRCVVTKEVFTQDEAPKLYTRQGQPIPMDQELRHAA